MGGWAYSGKIADGFMTGLELGRRRKKDEEETARRRQVEDEDRSWKNRRRQRQEEVIDPIETETLGLGLEKGRRENRIGAATEDDRIRQTELQTVGAERSERIGAATEDDTVRQTEQKTEAGDLSLEDTRADIAYNKQRRPLELQGLALSNQARRGSIAGQNIANRMNQIRLDQAERDHAVMAAADKYGFTDARVGQLRVQSLRQTAANMAETLQWDPSGKLAADILNRHPEVEADNAVGIDPAAYQQGVLKFVDKDGNVAKGLGGQPAIFKIDQFKQFISGGDDTDKLPATAKHLKFVADTYFNGDGKKALEAMKGADPRKIAAELVKHSSSSAALGEKPLTYDKALEIVTGAQAEAEQSGGQEAGPAGGPDVITPEVLEQFPDARWDEQRGVIVATDPATGKPAVVSE